MRILINVWLEKIMMDIWMKKDHKFIPFQIRIVTFADSTQLNVMECVRNNNFGNI